MMVLCTACNNPKDEKTAMNRFYIGTYTSGESEGIYRLDFNQETGEIGEVTLASKTENPSFLADGGGFIYAVNEDVESEPNAMITAWEIAPDGSLSETDRISSEGAYACYITTHENFALVANYGGGSVLSIPIDSAGTFGGPSQLIQHEGHGPDSSRQEGPHAHSIVLSPDKSIALSADLGIDKVMIYDVQERGMLMPADPPYIQMDPGAGPRHIAFHPTSGHMYVINELNNTVSVFDYEGNRFIKKQTIGTVPENSGGVSYCADIHVHPSGKFLYGSNRGHDSIVVFAIAKDGTLSVLQHFDNDVNWPRNFHITANGKYILIANERGNSIVVGEINQETGKITDTGKRIPVPAPVCILAIEES
jgi:6-phosphogluconolactonase